MASCRGPDDFSSLGRAESLDDSHGSTTDDRAGNGCSLKSQSTCDSSCPGNFILEELHELIRLYLKHQKAIDTVGSTQTESLTNSRFSESVDMYEPTHFTFASAPPPKRFHRTFWKSLTLRIVRLEKKKALHRAAMSDVSMCDSITSGATH
jgi:hypothetical protein